MGEIYAHLKESLKKNRLEIQKTQGVQVCCLKIIYGHGFIFIGQ